MKSKLLKRVECCYILGLNIVEFLDHERAGNLPQSIHNGMGERWTRWEIEELAKSQSLRKDPSL